MAEAAAESKNLMVLVSVIVVSFNTKDHTLECLASIYDQTSDLAFEVIVYDNASTDGSADAIAAEFPHATLIRGEENLGFGRANNAASKHASGAYILLLNPDTIVLDNAIKRLHDFAVKMPEARIWGGRTVNRDGTLNPTCVWRFPTNWSMFCQAVGLHRLFRLTALFNPEPYPRWARDTVRDVEIVTGCFLMITRVFWDKLGGFDEDFFMYSEEADLCYRTHKLGGRLMFTPDATIVHLDGATKQVAADKRCLLLAGRCEYMIKNWSAASVTLGKAILRLHVWIRMIGAKALAFRSGASPRLSLWKEVWNRRQSWLEGFADQRSSSQ